jgi:uroporphyrinogen decarboxylase
MTPREKFIAALEGRQPPGRVPHFELVYFLTMETFGRLHPHHRRFKQWDQMSERERDLHRRDVADLYVRIAERFEQSAIHVLPPEGWTGPDDLRATLEHIRELSGDRYCLLLQGDATYSIPNGERMVEFSTAMFEEPGRLMAEEKVRRALDRCDRLTGEGLFDGFCLCSDYCFNDNPFFSPTQFDELIGPYLAELVAGYRQRGYYVVKHTDGNIMPILDRLVAAKPHALHSLDPQGGVDIAEVKRQVGDRVCLIGNVSCAALDTGTDEEVVDSARYALRHGMPGGGYIFATSNCIYTGMDPARYELMLEVWRKEGSYEEPGRG